jgi:capsular polysaccharide biosynthesis protein
MIKSPEILAAAIRRQGITELDTIRAQEDPVSWLADRIRVVWRENSEIIKVNMTGVRRGREAIDAAKIVNAIVSTYLDQVVETGRVVVLEEATP